MIPTNMDRVIAISDTISQCTQQLQRLSSVTHLGFRDYTLNDPRQRYMWMFQVQITTSPAAQAFIEAFKIEREAEIERLKKELVEL